MVLGLLCLNTEFQSYQFRQINPDMTELIACMVLNQHRFQSYQFRQINPDEEEASILIKSNKDVSIVSIQTDQSRPVNRQHRS